MNSIVLYTQEIDNLNEAVEELFEQAKDFEFKQNSVALVFCEEDTEYPKLYEKLKEKWNIPFIGSTAMAMMNDKEGFCNVGISVLLLSADDCTFEAGISGKINLHNYEKEISEVYKPLSDKLNNEEKMVIAYSVIATSDDAVCGDDLLNAISTVNPNVPIFGGLASDNFNFTGNRIFFNETESSDGIVMLLVSGNVKPKYVSINSIENRAMFSYEITESKGNRVFKLGEYSFIDILGKENITTDKSDVLGDFLLSPFVVSKKMPNGEDVESARNLSGLNHEDGSGLFLGAMPEGSMLGVGIINREDVQKSVKTALSKTLDDLDESEYTYSTFFCNTCAARFLALASNTDAEANVCLEAFPKGKAFFGLYAYGEFCPVKGSSGKEEYNMFHNFTFTIVAF